MRKVIPLFLILLFFFNVSCNEKLQLPQIGMIQPSNVIEIPLVDINLPNAENELSENLGALAISTGFEDELPDGPTSFDILQDGAFVITDPLQTRITYFDTKGEFVAAQKLDFAVTRLKQISISDLLVERRGTSDYYIILDNGQPQITLDDQQISQLDTYGAAKLVNRNSGTVTPKGSSPITISFESDSLFLISIQNLGNINKNTVVLLETTTGAVPINIYRFLMVYSENGSFMGKIDGFSEDHHVFPDDEFRLYNGKLYQMSPEKDVLKIRIWNIE